MEDGRYFDQVTNPEYAEEYAAMLAELHDKGARLVQSAPDEVGPMPGELTGGAKRFSLTLHQEAMEAAGLAADFLSGDIFFLENHELPGNSWPNSTSIVLHRTHEVENIAKYDIEPLQEPVLPGEHGFGRPEVERTDKTGTVIVSDLYTIHDPKLPRPEAAAEQELWPLSHSCMYTDLEGNNVLPIFQKPQSPLTAIDYGIDLRGGEILQKLLEVEANIRGVELA